MSGLRILSMQSRVAFGQVGNVVAEFALRRLGCDVIPLDTVSFSNHPGYGVYRGRVHPAAEIAELLDGISQVGALAGCDAVLSGYLGDEANGGVLLEADRRLKASRPDALFCCDPVMGDLDEGLYVTPGLVRFFAEAALPRADVLTPNLFELGLLVSHPLATLKGVIAAAAAVRARGPRLVLVSSVTTADLEEGTIGTLLSTPEGALLATAPRRSLLAKGAGDLLAALFLFQLLTTEDSEYALEYAVGATHSVIEVTAAACSRELMIAEAQDALATPTLHPRLSRVA